MCAKIPTKEFSDLIKRFSNQEAVLLKYLDNTLTLGENKIDCDFQGSVDINLNSVYLANAIKQIDGNEFLLKTNGHKKEVSIQEVGNADKKYIIMQMN